MPEPNPETPRFPELPPDQLAEVKDGIEIGEMMLANPEALLSDEDAVDFKIGHHPITPYQTIDKTVESDEYRMHWNESEWPQVARMVAERFGIPVETILDARPEDESIVVLAERTDESGTFLLGISRAADEVPVGHVPYVLAETTPEIGWEAHD